jgi:hypothetical protein
MQALAANKDKEASERHTVDLDYKPGEIEVRINDGKGCTVLNGTWTVQHTS